VTRYTLLFTLQVRHGCYGAATPPLTIAPEPETARRVARAGMLIRTGPAWIAVVAPDARAGADPAPFRFSVRVTETALLSATEGRLQGEARVFELALSAAAPEVAAGAGDLRSAPTDDGRLIGRIDVSAAADGGDGAFVVTFPAAALPWTYVLTGGPADARFSVGDRLGAVAFRNVGRRRLSNGAPAQMLRSDAPITLAARPDPRFSLLRSGPLGAVVVAPVLPAPALGALCLAGGDINAEIHVNL